MAGRGILSAAIGRMVAVVWVLGRLIGSDGSGRPDSAKGERQRGAGRLGSNKGERVGQRLTTHHPPTAGTEPTVVRGLDLMHKRR